MPAIQERFWILSARRFLKFSCGMNRYDQMRRPTTYFCGQTQGQMGLPSPRGAMYVHWDREPLTEFRAQAIREMIKCHQGGPVFRRRYKASKFQWNP